MNRTARHTALAGLAVLPLLALTGCQAGAVRTGAAATVGQERITTSALDRVVVRGLADPTAAQAVGGDRAGFERSVLRRLIEHLVITDLAARQGVSVDGGDVDATQDRIARQLMGLPQLKAAALKSGIAPADLRETLSDVALRDKIADKLTADVQVPEAQLRAAYQQSLATYDQVHSAHILVANQALATSLLAKVKADPSSFGALAEQYSQDPGSKAKGGDLGFLGKGALEKPFETAIFSNAPGSFVLARTRFGYHVIHVLERRTTTFEQARADLRRGLLGPQRSERVDALLRADARRLGVHVNPRFGRWDPTKLDVVAPTADPATDITQASPTPGVPATSGQDPSGQDPSGEDPAQPQATTSP